MRTSSVISLLLATELLLACSVLAAGGMEKYAICDLDTAYLHVCAGCLNPDPCATCSMPIRCGTDLHLHNLDLSNIALGTLPNSFQNLEFLERLNLVNCSLVELPYYFGLLKSLVTLDVSDNPISALPRTFSPGLAKLKTFVANNNRIKTIDEDRFYLLASLEELSLVRNYMLYLPSKIGSISTLKKVNISLNAMKSLPLSFGQLKNLEVLDGSFNLFNEFRAGNLVSLRHLDLHTNVINTLYEDFGNLTSLTSLDLSNNELKSLPDAFGQLIGLTDLNLDGNCLNCDEVQLNPNFTPFIKSKCIQWTQRKC